MYQVNVHTNNTRQAFISRDGLSMITLPSLKSLRQVDGRLLLTSLQI